MIKKIFSIKMAVPVLLIFAVTIGCATFIENDYGTQTARALIYQAKWFEILLFYFISIVVFNIFKFKMYKRAKWGQLVLHSAFLCIAIGAVLTRYIGYEGVLHLREGQTSNKMVSDHMVLTLGVKDGNSSYIYDRKMIFSSMTKNRIEDKIKAGDKEINIELLKYLPSAKEGVLKLKDGGSKYLELMIAPVDAAAKTVFIKSGEAIDFDSFVLAYNLDKNYNKPVVNIKDRDKKLIIKTSQDIFTKSMDSLENKNLKPGEYEFKRRTLYSLSGNSFVLKGSYKNGKLDYINSSLKSNSMMPQMVKLKISSSKDSKEIALFGRDGVVGEPKTIKLNGINISLSYGAKIIPLPFAIKLNKFELERYPGSMQPSSYASRVTVIDKDKKFDYHIFMNHVLDYRGYRFFQSSYDTDEKGSILSVNHDPGTLLTYIGYFMLALGFIWSFFF